MTSFSTSLRLWKPALDYLRMQRLRCLALLGLMVLSALISAAPAVIFQRILNAATGEAERSVLLGWLALAVGVLGLSYLLTILRGRLSVDLTAGLTQRLQRRAFLFLMTRSASEPTAKGDLNALVTSSRGIASFVLGNIPSSASTVLSSLTCFAVALAYDPLTSLLAVIAPVFLYRSVARQMTKIQADTRADFQGGGQTQSFVNQAIERLGEIKASNTELRFYRRWSAIVAEATAKNSRLSLNINMFGLSSRAITDLVTLVVILVGAIRIYAGALTITELVAIQMLLLRAVAPLTVEGNLRSNFERARTALEVLERAGQERETGRALASSAIAAPITLEGVSLSYGERRALQDVSVSLPETGLVAIVGRNGSGKTSLIQVLGGSDAGHEGRVVFNGLDIAGIRPRALRRGVASVSQSPVVFPGTLRENLLHLAPGRIDQSGIEAALASSTFARDLETMPMGLETEISGFGEGLSGGQRQKLAIARALLSPAKVLILDEPSSALDSTAAARLTQDLAGHWSRHRLVLVVTHDERLIEAADLVLRLEADRGGIGR